MPFTTKYSHEEKLNAVNYYCVYGSSKKVAQMTGVPAPTIRNWTKTEWWAEMMSITRQHMQDKLDGKFTGLIHRAMTELEDRIKNGDEVVDTRTGRSSRKKMAGKDIALTLAQIIDKRALLRGEATSHRRTTNVDTIQKQLEERTEEIRKEKKAEAVRH